VLDQDYPALEYVVQDGGSADGTAAILERYDDRLARWTSAPDEGQAHALNLGFADTRGELMAYLNADDILLPGSLAYVSAYFAAHPDVDVVYGHRVIIDHNGHRVGVWVTPRHCDHALRHVDYVPQETTFWRRNIWEAIGGGFDEELHFAMDWDLLLRFRAAGARFVRLPRLVGAFRVLPGQKTQAQADVGERECMRMRKQHLGRALTHEQAGALVRGYLRRSAAHHLAFRARERLEPRWVTVEAGPIESRTGAPPQATSVPR
jgi:GT2 family glycosyltransferase